MDKTRNVFLSHYHKDEANIQKLKDLLAPKGYIIKNSSVESSKPNKLKNTAAIKRLLRMRIHWAGTFICLIGPETHTRKWVDWEIEQANKKGKRIVGLYIRGANKSDVPMSFEKYGDSLIGWNTDKIIGAIEGKINNWENPDGSTRPSRWSNTRSEC